MAQSDFVKKKQNKILIDNEVVFSLSGRVILGDVCSMSSKNTRNAKSLDKSNN